MAQKEKNKNEIKDISKIECPNCHKHTFNYVVKGELHFRCKICGNKFN